MAGKAKPKARRPRADEAGVLASLPTTRPSRLGRHNRSTVAAKAAPKAKAKSRPKGVAKPKAAAKPRAVPSPTPITDVQRPRAVRAGAKGLKSPAKKSGAQRPVSPPENAPTGTDLVTTVVQAAGELAQVGLSIGGQVLKRAVDRLPKP
jgi:hypothetical protein